MVLESERVHGAKSEDLIIVVGLVVGFGGGVCWYCGAAAVLSSWPFCLYVCCYCFWSVGAVGFFGLLALYLCFVAFAVLR